MTGKLLVDEDKATHATRSLNRIPKLTLLGSLDAQIGIGGVSHCLEANFQPAAADRPDRRGGIAQMRRASISRFLVASCIYPRKPAIG